jgi:hypothetical protein
VTAYARREIIPGMTEETFFTRVLDRCLARSGFEGGWHWGRPAYDRAYVPADADKTTDEPQEQCADPEDEFAAHLGSEK